MIESFRVIQPPMNVRLTQRFLRQSLVRSMLFPIIFVTGPMLMDKVSQKAWLASGCSFCYICERNYSLAFPVHGAPHLKHRPKHYFAMVFRQSRATYISVDTLMVDCLLEKIRQDRRCRHFHRDNRELRDYWLLYPMAWQVWRLPLPQTEW